MDLIDLTLIWVVIIGIGIFMYVLMDGFDLGVGILFPFAPSDAARDELMNSVAPVWDGNETWLILGGAGLLAAFPMIYAVFLPALYLGVFLLLAGLIFRGVAFEFRFKAQARKYWWDRTEGFRYVGGPLDWLTPFTVMTGLGVVAGYALLGVTWAILKTEGETQRWAYRLAPWLLTAVMGFFVIVSLWTPLAHERVMTRWFDHLSWLWLFPTLTLAVAAWVFWRIRQGAEAAPFIGSMLLFALFYLGLLITQWPYAVPPNYTFWDAAYDPGSQLFLLIGMLFLIPIILGYTAWTYWVFRGKVKSGEGYAGH